jgi:hypothetical protein
MPREEDSRHRPRRRLPASAFETWLVLLDVLVVEPLIDLVRLIWKSFRGDRL